MPTGGTPGVPEAEARRPAVGARTVELAFTCPLDSNTAFILVGRCLDGPEFPDFAITPCGAGCGQRVDPNGILIEGRQLAGQFREATIEIPVPPISSLAGTDLCFQFLCFHTVGDVSHCREISQTLRLTLY